MSLNISVKRHTFEQRLKLKCRMQLVQTAWTVSTGYSFRHGRSARMRLYQWRCSFLRIQDYRQMTWSIGTQIPGYMVIGDFSGSCTRNLFFALCANGEAYPILPEMKQQLWTLPLVREGRTTDMWYVIQVQGGQEEKTAELIKKQLTLCDCLLYTSRCV